MTTNDGDPAVPGDGSCYASHHLPNISYEHCQRVITNRLTPVGGVRRIMVDIPTKEVHVDDNEARIDVERLKAIL